MSPARRAGGLRGYGHGRREIRMNDTTPAIRPFVAAVPDDAIDDLKARLARTR